MSSDTAPSQERLFELLTDHATCGLDAGPAQELDELLTAHPDYDVSYFEPAAAVIDLAMMPPVDESVPSALRDRILTDAGRFLATVNVREAAPQSNPELRVVKSDRVAARPRNRAAWYLAAASLALAVVGWWQVLSPGSQRTVAISQQFADFVRTTDDLIRAPWAGKEPGFEGVSGEVVWSDVSQRGFMRLVDLPPNDPNVAQYQLWIVDPNRDTHPVDGGVFDVSNTGETIVPIDAKLRADQPGVFAITLEKPGGVVVSGGPLLVVAS